MVTVAVAVPGALAEPVRLAGDAVAREEVVAANRGVAGPIIALLAEVGDRVAAGQVLARIDDEGLRHRAAQLAADAAQAAATLAQAEAQVGEAAVLAGEAARSLERGRALTAALADEVMDARAASAAAAQARLAAARAAVAAARAAVGRQDALLAENELALRRTAVTAPAAGLVLARAARLGAQAEPGSALFVLAAEGEIEIAAEAPERVVGAWEDGRTVSVRFGTAIAAGSVRRSDPQVAPATRLGCVRIALRAPDGLRPGMSAVVDGAMPAVAGLVVPLAAVQRRDGRAGVLLAVPAAAGDGPRTAVVRRIEVAVGAEDASRAVITAGLAAGDLVVARAPDYVADGTRCGIVAEP